MKKYPFVKQEGLKDCGVCCLQMIIKYYKGYVPISKLRHITKTTKDGTTAYHLINALESLGFKAQGVECSLNVLKQEHLPLIAHVTIDNIYNHYIVIYEIDHQKQQLLIADPNSEIYKISFKDFKKIWNKIVILVNPIKKIPIYKSTNLFKFLKFCLKPYKFKLLSLFIMSLIITILSIVTSFFLQFMIDGLNKQNNNYFIFISLIFLTFSIFKILIQFFRNKMFIKIYKDIDKYITNDTFSKIINLPYLSYCTQTTGEYISKIYDLNSIRNIITKLILNLFVDIVLGLFSIIFLFKINIIMSFLTLLIFSSNILVILIYKKKIENSIKQIQKEKDITTSIMIESISGYETVKNLNLENYILKNFKEKYNNLLKYNSDYHQIINKEQLIKDILHYLSITIITLIGIYLTLNSKITLGSLLTFQALVNYFLMPVQDIFNLDYELKESILAFNRIINLESDDDITYGNKKISSYTINFLHTSYTHFDKYKILDDITFTIKEKDKVFLTGLSGSGKSTILKLISKKYPSNIGQVYIGNIDICSCNKDSFKNNISYISQNETLFTKPIYDNLTLGKIIDDSIFQKVMKVCEIDKLLVSKKKNLFSLIEENGNTFSGGERQQIILGRILLQNSKILLIDEGLNQMDISLERRILKNIIENYANKTIIVVSHRFDNIDLFNHLLEIKDGKIIKDLKKGEKYEQIR